ncbi:hypothetical protein DBIPINDM_008543 (plasmid) [Mesorhizobium sp. AR02]|nr:chemotaxis protein CheB [Mesorhizobium sp. AR02]UVK57353.1 hypothetical protein DBIPINDM_008543 [Mesorhizobium sp. AR02]
MSAKVPVIGIGASAGGIEALGQFFDAMSADSDCAFVVVLHLDPKRESEMANVLSARTAMPVVQVADGMRLEGNHVYVIAPNSDLRIGDGACTCQAGRHRQKAWCHGRAHRRRIGWRSADACRPRLCGQGVDEGRPSRCTPGDDRCNICGNLARKRRRWLSSGVVLADV